MGNEQETAERLLDQYEPEIALLSEGDGLYQKREPDAVAGIEAEIDRLMPTLVPYLEAVRAYEIARGYHEALKAAYRSDAAYMKEWANGEMLRFDRGRPLKLLGAKVGELETEELTETVKKLKKLLRLREEIAAELPGIVVVPSD